MRVNNYMKDYFFYELGIYNNEIHLFELWIFQA